MIFSPLLEIVGKLEIFLTKQENNENKQDSVEASTADVYKSANESFIAKNLENNREIKIEEKSNNQTNDRLLSESLEMNKTIVQIRGLSLKDALDLKPLITKVAKSTFQKN